MIQQKLTVLNWLALDLVYHTKTINLLEHHIMVIINLFNFKRKKLDIIRDKMLLSATMKFGVQNAIHNKVNLIKNWLSKWSYERFHLVCKLENKAKY